MSDMTFGPQWLRKMANTGQNHPPPLKSPTKHVIARAPLKLAEHRYGREEMLALLNPGISPPNALQHFSELLRRESMTPLSFAPLNDEEQRAQALGVNSQIVMRMRMNRAGRGGGAATQQRMTSSSSSSSSRGGKREGGGAYQRVGVGGDVEGAEDFEHEGRRKTSDSRSEHLSNWRSAAEMTSEKEEDVWNLKSPSATDTWQVVGGLKHGWRDHGNAAAAAAKQRLHSDDHVTQFSSSPRDVERKPDSADVIAEQIKEKTANMSLKETTRSHDDDDDGPVKETVPLPKFYSAGRGRGQINMPSSSVGTSYPGNATRKQAVDMETFAGEGDEEEDSMLKGLELSTKNLVDGVVKDDEKDIISKKVEPEPMATVSAPPPGPPPSPGQPIFMPAPPPSSTGLFPVPESFTQWFYMDPQREIQGPFTGLEMYDWFNSGYFTMNLLVRRACDEELKPLGEMINVYGRIPFEPGMNPPPPPPIVKGRANEWHLDAMKNAQAQAQAFLHFQQQQQLLQQQKQNVQQQEKKKKKEVRVSDEKVQSSSPQKPITSPVWTSADVQMKSVSPQDAAMLPAPIWRTGSLSAWDTVAKDREEERKREEAARIQKEMEESAKKAEENERRLRRQREEEEERERERIQKEKEEEEERIRRHQEEERLKREAEEKRRKKLEAEEKRLKREAEEKRRREEIKRKQEEIRKLEEEAQKQQQLALQKQQEAAKQKQVQALNRLRAEQKQKQMPPPPPKLSLLEIQKQEIAAAAAEQQQQQQLQQKQQQQQKQQNPKPAPKWSSPPTGTGAPSLAQIIQQEQATSSKNPPKQPTQAQRIQGSNNPWSGSASASAWGGPSTPDETQGGLASFWNESLAAVEERRDDAVTNAPPPPRRFQAQAKKTKKHVAKVETRKETRDEEIVRRHFQAAAKSASNDELRDWCERKLQPFERVVDISGFISFLTTLDNAAEICEYIDAYLGTSGAAKDFARGFLERHGSVKSRTVADVIKGKSQTAPPPSDSLVAFPSLSGGGGLSSGTPDGETGFQQVSDVGKKGRKKRRRVQQRVDATSLLSYNVTAGERHNQGEIKSAHDVS